MDSWKENLLEIVLDSCLETEWDSSMERLMETLWGS